MSSFLQGMTAFFIATLVLLGLLTYSQVRLSVAQRKNLEHRKEKSIYKEAWDTLAMCFGEWMQQEELDFMDSVLQSVKLDQEEYEQWLLKSN